jgi:flagellar biosynthetic protein FliQ
MRPVSVVGEPVIYATIGPGVIGGPSMAPPGDNGGQLVLGIQEAIGVSYEALIVIIKITFPLLLAATIVGLVFTVFQSVTHINETSLQQNFKILAVLVLLFVEAPAIYFALRDYTLVTFDRIEALAPPFAGP